MHHLGVAAAVHGLGQKKLTTTIVGGSDKHQLRIEQKETVPLDVDSVTDVREKFRGLLRTTSRLIHSQRGNFPMVPVPLVFGMPTSHETGAFLAKLCEAFSYTVPRLPEAAEPTHVAQSQAYLSPIGFILSDCLKRGNPGLTEGRHFLTSVRGFIDSDPRQGDASDPGLKAYLRREGEPWGRVFETLRNGGAAQREVLKMFVEDRAMSMVQDALTLTDGANLGIREI